MKSAKSTFRNPLPVFIVSSGRSGTTLLRSILNTSTELYIPHESDFIARAYSKFGLQTSYCKNDYLQLLKIFKLESQSNGWDMNLEHLLAELEEYQPKSFAEVNEIVYYSFLKLNGHSNKRWGIKAPVLIASIDVILKVFPGAKIIHLVRDGRDVCISYKQVHRAKDTRSFGPNGTLANALYWIDGLRRIEKRSDHQVFELRYEDLVLETEHTLKKVCEFINIQFSKTMVTDFFKKANTGITENEKETIHKNISRPIDKGNVNKYLKYMKKRDRLLYEFISYPYLNKYGYMDNHIIMNSTLFSWLRLTLYQAARLYNDWRYSARDRRLYKNVNA